MALTKPLMIFADLETESLKASKLLQIAAVPKRDEHLIKALPTGGCGLARVRGHDIKAIIVLRRY